MCRGVHVCAELTMTNKKPVTASEIGSKGGKATARKMTKEQLKERGQRAIAARWAKPKTV